MAPVSSGSNARKWPPLTALIVGFLMVFLALPNPLRVPSNNPNTTAEFAPVPGTSEDQQQGNFAETGLAQSPGLGAGDNTGLGLGLGQLPPGQEVPVDKECVGDPPRQTEDPLSPPCVPYFSGKNGGATYQGVTGNEIKVVLYNDDCVEGDMTVPYQPSDECGSQADYEAVNLVKTIKYQLRYFQRRFQTYGRAVHVIAQPSSGGLTTPPEGRRTDAVTTQALYRPFATAFFGDNAQDYFVKMASYEVPSFGLNFDVPRAYYERYAPYVYSFISDQETETDWSAAFLCRALRPGELRARFSTDPLLSQQERKIGFIYEVDSPRGTAREELAVKLKRSIAEQCDGYTFDAEATFKGGAGAGSREAAQIIADFKLKGITTVVCYCLGVPSEATVTTMQNAATAAEYFPEWFWDQASAMDRPIWLQAFASKQHENFGVTYFWRNPAFREQMWYQAYTSETRDNSVPNVRFNFTLYQLFMNLFTAIQAAGPELTPESVERGMFTFRYFDPNYVWLPTGGYGPDGPGTYTFIDTAMAWYWDPTGQPPGGKPKEGCQRVMNGGRRYYSDRDGDPPRKPLWPLGDEALARAKQDGPCTEDNRKLRDAQPGDLH